jgi:hypothetical protein
MLREVLEALCGIVFCSEPRARQCGQEYREILGQLFIRPSVIRGRGDGCCFSLFDLPLWGQNMKMLSLKPRMQGHFFHESVCEAAATGRF